MSESDTAVSEATQSHSGILIGEMLKVSGKDLEETLADHVREHTKSVGVPRALLGYVADETAQAIGKQLKLDVFELAFKAWAAIRELQEYADPARHPPEETALLRWGNCSIQAPQRVDVKLQVAGIALPLLTFTIDIKAEFRALALSIRNGAILKVTPGPANASVAFKYRDTKLGDECKTPEVKFEHGIEFRPALQIGWHASSAGA